mgnify:CR=1 FL=1
MYARRVRLCPTQRVGLNVISLLTTLPAVIYVARFSAKSARAREQRREKTIAAIIIFSTRRKSARAHSSLLTRLTIWAKQP